MTFFLTIVSCSEVDVTGITELSVNSSTYQVANDSVILQNDAEKYLESVSEDDSNERCNSTFCNLDYTQK